MAPLRAMSVIVQDLFSVMVSLSAPRTERGLASWLSHSSLARECSGGNREGAKMRAHNPAGRASSPRLNSLILRSVDNDGVKILLVAHFLGGGPATHRRLFFCSPHFNDASVRRLFFCSPHFNDASVSCCSSFYRWPKDTHRRILSRCEAHFLEPRHFRHRGFP